MREWFSWMRQRRELWLTWFCGLLLLSQTFNLHSYVVLNVENQAIVASNDDDASWNVSKTIKTRWWKDNGWALYGPFYFRLNHSNQYFWSKTASPQYTRSEYVWERTAHHSIMTVSLLSVVALSLLIGCVLLTPWWARFLFAGAITSALLSNPVWSQFVLRAHPDQLFNLVIAGAFLLMLKWWCEPANKVWAWMSGALWGISISVKMTLSLCTPGFVLLFVPPFKRERLRAGVKYLSVILLAYFVIGFPQTIVLDRPIKILWHVGGLSAAPTLQSVVQWLTWYFEQLWRPTLVIFLAAVLLPRQRLPLWPCEGGWRFHVFVVFPFLFLLSKNMMIPSSHYVLPFAALFLVWLALQVRRLSWRWEPRPLRQGSAFAALWLALLGSTPDSLQAELDLRTYCRDGAREAQAMLLQLYDKGARIWADPYVPNITFGPRERTDVGWEKTWDGWARDHWNVLALNEAYMRKFLVQPEPDGYTQAEIKGWPQVREFYSAFVDKTEAVAPTGEKFIRHFKSSCGHEIWVLDSLLKSQGRQM